MPSNLLARVYPPVNGAAELATGDTTKTVIAAVTNKTHCITSLFVSVLTSAAQTVTIQSSGGTVILAKLPASPGITQFNVELPERGVDLAAGEALVITPAAAGPGVFVRASGVTKG